MNRLTGYCKGVMAETLCQLTLRLKGYGILAMRYRSQRGEIDILAKRSNMIAEIEVKARPTEHDAMESDLPSQRQRIAKAACDFLVQQHRPNPNLRFDIMLFMPRRWPTHIVEAWRP
jgi:putative endonuclease